MQHQLICVARSATSCCMCLQVGKVSTTEEGVEPEPHPLWEYPAYARSEVTELMNFDLCSLVPEAMTLRATGVIPLNKLQSKPCHGVVLWMDYQLSENTSASTGLIKVCSQHLLSVELAVSLLVSCKYDIGDGVALCFYRGQRNLERSCTGTPASSKQSISSRLTTWRGGKGYRI